MSDRARSRELLQRNRLLVRQEGLAELDVSRLIASMADELARRASPGVVDPLLAIVDEHVPDMAAVLRRRSLQTALLFGERTGAALGETIPKAMMPLEGKGFWETFQTAITAWVDLHALARAITVTGTIRERVRDLLLLGHDEGWSEATLARAIQERVGQQLSRTNAARIARTEMHTASSVGSDEAARATALQMIKEWAAAEDRRTRFSHAVADGAFVALDDPFQVGSAKLMIPGDPHGPAEEIINCRCQGLHHPVIAGLVYLPGRQPTPVAELLAAA